MLIALAALLAAALPAIPRQASKDSLKADRKLLRSTTKELKKKKAWPLAAGQVLVIRAAGNKGEPALVLVRGSKIHARVVCTIKDAGPQAAEDNAVAERVWSFTGSAQGVKAMERFQLPAQLRDAAVEVGARGDGDNFHSAVFLEPQSADAKFVLDTCAVKGE